MIRINFLKLFLLLHFKGFLCLEILSLDVPSFIMIGDSVWLNCTLDQDDTLYSLKWYKDQVQFYHYFPRYSSARTFDVPGIHLDLQKSAGGHVFLTKTDMDTEGLFMCLASARHDIVSRYKELKVYALPEEGPKMEGIHSRYEVGEYINVTCKFGPSKPGAHLKWYINGTEAMPEAEIYYPPQKDEYGLQTTTLGLKFEGKREFFKDGVIKLRCTATIPEFYSASVETTISFEKQVVTSSSPAMLSKFGKKNIFKKLCNFHELPVCA